MPGSASVELTKETEAELEEFRQKLKIPLMEFVEIMSEKEKEEEVGKRHEVQITLQPPQDFSQGMVRTVNTLFRVVDTDGHDVRELYKHGELAVFGWIYSFGDDGLTRRRGERPEGDADKAEEFFDFVSRQMALLGPNLDHRDTSDGLSRYFSGCTKKTPEQFHGWLIKNREKYQATAYSISENNCLHFVKASLDFLEVGTPQPLEKILIWIRDKGADALKRLYAQSRKAQESSGSGNAGRSMFSSGAGTQSTSKSKSSSSSFGSSQSPSFINSSSSSSSQSYCSIS